MKLAGSRGIGIGIALTISSYFQVSQVGPQVVHLVFTFFCPFFVRFFGVFPVFLHSCLLFSTITSQGEGRGCFMVSSMGGGRGKRKKL